MTSRLGESISNVRPRYGISHFDTSVLSVLERTEYRFCESGEDLEAIYRLRYDSYLAAGMVRTDAAHMMTDQFDDLPNAYRFGIFFEGVLVSTIRLHYVDTVFPVSPSSEVFGDVLESRIASGETFVDPSRFATAGDWSRTLRVLPYVTLRLAILACQYFKAKYCLTAVKEEHSAFYHRIFRSIPAAGARSYPGLTMPVHLLQSKCSDNLEYTIARFPFFNATAFERRMLFERPKHGAPAPLTILPTAKYLNKAA